jgi:hypothetical protein
MFPNRFATLPTTTSNWQIYSTMDGADAVAVELTEALKAAAKAVVGGVYVREAMKQHMQPVLFKHREYGTLDSESSYTVAEDYLDKVSKGLALEYASEVSLKHSVNVAIPARVRALELEIESEIAYQKRLVAELDKRKAK